MSNFVTSASPIVLSSLLFLVCTSHTSAATVLDLHVLDVGGALFEVDATDATEIGVIGLPFGRQWNDIAATSFDPTGVYAVSLESGTAARNVSRIDTTDGSVADIPMTNNAVGGPNPLSFGWWAIAFDPREPQVGYIGLTVSHSGGGQSHGIARFNIETQSFEHSVSTSHRWASLAMNENGELIGSVDFFDENHASDGTTEVYDIDPNTGLTSLRFTTGYRDLTGLAFHPEDGRLFAINAFQSDELNVINSDSGALVTAVGSLPTGGPNGLAFTTATIEIFPGDGNGDGKVDGTDYLIWADNYGDDPADDPPGAPANGDFNDDGVVDGVDYVTWAIHFGQGPNDLNAVPEPTTFGLLVFGALPLMFGRRRGR